MITAVIRASTPWTVIPTMRKGSSRSHTIGYRINATRASGQQTTNRRHQSKNAAMGDPPLLVTDASGKKFIRLPAGDLRMEEQIRFDFAQGWLSGLGARSK